MSFSYSFPGRIIFGAGEAEKFAPLLPEGRVLIICGGHAEKWVRDMIARGAFQGREVRVFAGIGPEPELGEAEKLRFEALKWERDGGGRIASVAGIGGGSALDMAKTLSVLLDEAAPLEDFFYKRAEFCTKGRFFAALPTTAGTGAEVTPNAVLSDEKTLVKQSIRANGMFADLVVADPQLTYDSPRSVTAGSGMDALTQAIEGYCSLKSTCGSRALSLAGAKLIYNNLAAAAENDCKARDLTAEGSLLGALAFAQSSLGSVHGIGHPLGSILGVPHGVCCAVLLTEVLKRNYAADAGRLDELAQGMGLKNGVALLEGLADLRRQLGLPDNFSGWGLNSSHFDFVVKNCRSGSMKTNPYDFSDDEVYSILESLC